MIPVRRGDEPEALRYTRLWRLARLVLWEEERRHLDEGERLQGFEFKGYDATGVRETLYQRQHGKCVYCDRWSEQGAQPIEHHRPKGSAKRDRTLSDPLCYAWLAWSWNNLFFACTTCNSATYKSNHYPLEPGAPALPWLEQPDRWSERTLLIDPSRERPSRHIQFIDDGLHWRPVPRAGSPHGAKTIDVLGLDRPDLLTRYDNHIQTIKPDLDAVEALVSSVNPGPLSKIQASWTHKISKLLGEPRKGWTQKELACLTWDAIDQRVPLETRRRLGLKLPPLGAGLPDDPPLTEADNHLQGMDDATRWWVRAVGPPGSSRRSDYLQEALYALIVEQAPTPLSAAEMMDTIAKVHDISTKDVNVALQSLLNGGRILQIGSGFSRPD